MIKKVTMSLLIITLAITFFIPGAFANNNSVSTKKNVLFITEKEEKTDKFLDKANIYNVTSDSWNQLGNENNIDTIWVREAALNSSIVKKYLQQKVKEGTRIYFLKKNISLNEVFSYLNITDYKIKEGDGSSPTGEKPFPLSTEVFGVQKIDNIYATFVLRFEKPEPELIVNKLVEDTQEDPVAKFYSSTSGDVTIQNFEDWPIAYINSTSDMYAYGEVAFSYKLSRHPNNPYNSKNYYACKQIVEATPYYSSTLYALDYVYPTISAGSNGIVYDYSPDSGTTSSSTITVSLPFSLSWTFDIGTVDRLKMSKYSGGIGGTWTKWQAEPVDYLGRHISTPNTIRVEPGMEFYVDPSEDSVRAYSSYTVNFKNATTTKPYSNSFDTWVSN